MHRVAAVSALLLVAASCAENSHALARRDEVRAYREQQAQAPPSPRGIGPWLWGMCPTEVLVHTPRAWREGASIHATVIFDGVEGLATFGFEGEQLVHLSIVVPNRGEVESELRRMVAATLGAGDAHCPSCDRRAAAIGIGVAAGVLTTLSIAAALAGGHSGFSPDVGPFWYPPGGPTDEAPTTVEWKTLSTEATLTLAPTMASLDARARSHPPAGGLEP